MFEVHLKEFDSEVLLEGASDVGRIWFTLNGTSFPEDEWLDFPISVLGSTIEAFCGLVEGASDSFSYFFEGPYYLYYNKSSAGDGLVFIEATTDRNDVPEVLASAEILLSDLGSMLLRSAESLRIALAWREGQEHVELKVSRMINLLRVARSSGGDF